MSAREALPPVPRPAPRAPAPRRSPELDVLIAQLAAIAGLPGPRGRALARADERIDWGRWLRLVDENQLGSLLWARTRGEGLPEPVARALHERYARAGLEATFRQVELARLLDRLAAVTTPVLLKGSALVHTLYETAAERPMSDIDLLLPDREALPAATRILASEGYLPERRLEAHAPERHHHDPPLTNPAAELTLELHAQLSTPPLPEPVMAALWAGRERIERGGVSMWVLDPVGRALHHALHAVADPIDSPLLRNLFETAWLIARLNDEERARLRELLARPEVAALAAPGVELAARLFGLESLSDPRPAGACELWSLARLEWCDSFDLERPFWAGLKRSLAREHLKVAPRGAVWTALAFARILLQVFVGAVLGRVAALAEARVTAIEAIAFATVPIGDRLLAHDRDSGAVHLLDPVSARVWAAAAAEGSVDRLEAALARDGVPPRETRAAIARLLDAGLLRVKASSLARRSPVLP